jgi:hypothetical protein
MWRSGLGPAFVSILAAVAISAATAGPAVAAGNVMTANHAASVAGTWTFALVGGACEVDHFHTNGTFTTVRYGDAGTWTGAHGRLHMHWTRGADATTTFTGTFDRAIMGYAGTWVAGGASYRATLVRGAECT